MQLTTDFEQEAAFAIIVTESSNLFLFQVSVEIKKKKTIT